MRAVNRSTRHQKLIDTLAKKEGQSDGVIRPFKTIKAMQCYAALLGFQEQRRSPLEKGSKDNIEWHIFKNGGFDNYIYLIALAEVQDVKILRYNVKTSSNDGSPEDMVQIFEEYANGGFEILQEWLNKMPSDTAGINAVIAGLLRNKLIFEEAPDSTPFEDVDF